MTGELVVNKMSIIVRLGKGSLGKWASRSEARPDQPNRTLMKLALLRFCAWLMEDFAVAIETVLRTTLLSGSRSN